jgi:hypothetical protein
MTESCLLGDAAPFIRLAALEDAFVLATCTDPGTGRSSRGADRAVVRGGVAAPGVSRDVNFGSR